MQPLKKNFFLIKKEKKLGKKKQRWKMHSCLYLQEMCSLEGEMWNRETITWGWSEQANTGRDPTQKLRRKRLLLDGGGILPSGRNLVRWRRKFHAKESIHKVREARWDMKGLWKYIKMQRLIWTEAQMEINIRFQLL